MSDQLSQVFAALGDPLRRDLVSRLAAGGDATLTELAAEYPVSLQAVAKHVTVLERAGLVTKGRHAQRRPLHLEAEVFDLATKWLERYRRQVEERYRRLDELLEAAATAGDPTTTEVPAPPSSPAASPPPQSPDTKGIA